jgi:hypothetical protein
VLQDDTSQDAPAEQPEEAAERVVVHEALSQPLLLFLSLVVRQHHAEVTVTVTGTVTVT